MREWISERLKERTTWLGLIGLLSAAGIGVDPEQAETIAAGGVALSSLLLAATKD